MRQLPEEFNDVSLILDMGAKKYGEDSWLKGLHFDHKSNHASMARHIAEAYCHQTEDHESGYHPLLHLASRALMEYTLWKRGSNLQLDDEVYMKLQEYLASNPLPNEKLKEALRASSDLLDSINES